MRRAKIEEQNRSLLRQQHEFRIVVGIHRRLGRKLHPGVKHVLAPAHSFKESTEEPGERSTFVIKREN